MAKEPISPLPWRVERRDRVRFTDFMVCDSDGEELMSLYTNDGADEPKWLPVEANAEFIVRAVNAHDELIAALKAVAVEMADDAQRVYSAEQFSDLATRWADRLMAHAKQAEGSA